MLEFTIVDAPEKRGTEPVVPPVVVTVVTASGITALES
jgi:hypothetical protein